jgi:hypothetical protein
MSSLPPVASIASQPPVAYTPPVDRTQDAKAPDKDDAAAEKAAGKVAELTATAVKAQATKESGKGVNLDIQV